MLNGKPLRRLTIKSFHINQLAVSDSTGIEGRLLQVDKSLADSICQGNGLVSNVNMRSIAPGQHDVFVNTIMDILPVSAKIVGKLGEGITHTLTGVYVLLTGCDEDGRQMAEFGSSQGILADQLMLGKAGTPSETDWILHVDVTLKRQGIPDRSQPNAAFHACDQIMDEIRACLKGLDGRASDGVHIYEDKVELNKKRVLIIKQVAGQGAMYDNLLFPSEPSGFKGGKSIIDIGNVPVVLSPNEYRDGAIRALT